MVADSKKKNNNDDSTSRLLILCCTANMGNAQPTAHGLQAWVPKNGLIQSVTPLNSECQAKLASSSSSSFDIIMVGMQEATWKTKKKSNDDKVEEEEEADDVDDEFYDYNDETERSGCAVDDFTTTTPAAKPTEADEVAKRNELKILWSSASFLKQIMTAEDSKFIRTLLQENLGTFYNIIQEYQRGQMRLYLFVKQSLVHEITNLDIKAENTGIGRVYSNKGGIIVQFTIRQTRLAFFTAHLAAHEGETHYATRNMDIKEILHGCKPSNKAVPAHMANIYDASLASHHMFVMGDLNYRTHVPTLTPAIIGDSSSNAAEKKKMEHAATVQRILNMIQAGDFTTLYSYDELSAGIRNKDVLCNFQTLPCHFPPTFKMLRAEGFQYKSQRIPSYTDRILYTSADDLQSKLTPLAYEPCPGFITSDHKPVRGVFEIQTNGSSSSTSTSNSNEMTEPISITFSNMKCTNLPAGDIDGSSDPYIMFVCDPVDLVKDDRDPKDTKKTIQRQLGGGNISTMNVVHNKIKWPCTSYIAKNLNPTWDNEKVKLCIPSTNVAHMRGAMLYITVMDYDLSTQDDVLCTLPLNIAKLVALPNSSEKEKTIEIDSPLLKYGEELGRIQCKIHVQRGGIEYYGQRSTKFGLCSCFGR